jgi:hypothetical protein
MVFIHPLVIVDVAGQNQVGHAPGIANGILGRVGHLRVPVKNVERIDRRWTVRMNARCFGAVANSLVRTPKTGHMRVNRGRRKTD